MEPPVDAPWGARRAIGPQRRAGGRADLDRLVAAVGNEVKPAPRDLEGALADHLELAGPAVERHHMPLPEVEQILVVREPDLVGLRPVERGRVERALGEGIGDLADEALEARELLAPAP